MRFLTWEAEHGIEGKLVSAGEFHPYPKAAERRDWEELPVNQKKQLIAEAEKYLDFQWPALLATDFMAFYRNGDRMIYEDPHFLRRRALSALVIGECAQGKGRFLDDIINGVWLICEESFWGVSAHNGKLAFIDTILSKHPLPNIEEPFIDLFAAETGGLMAWILYLLKPELDQIAPQVCRRISLELERRIKLPYLNHNDTNWMGYIATNKVNNWNPWINSNVLNVFLLTEADSYRRDYAVKKMFGILDNFLATYGADGGCDEGTSYWSRAGGALHDCCDQLYRASDGQIDFFAEPLMKEIGRFIYREHIAGPYFINFADGGAKATCDRELVYHYGKCIGDEKLMDLAAALPPFVRDDLGGAPNSLHRRLCTLFDCQGFEERRLSAKPPYVQDVWLPDIQVMAARTQEGSDRGLYLAAKGGHNDESHNHNDVGSFLVYLNGEPMLIDAGVGVYTKKTFSAQRYEIWTMQSGYHNLPVVNGAGQPAGGEFRAADVRYGKDQGNTSFSLELAGAYPQEARLLSLKRNFLFDRDSDMIMIRDAYCFKQDDNQVTSVLMCREKPELQPGGKIWMAADERTGLIIEYPDMFAAAVEEILVEDKRLQGVWGHRIYRVLLQASALPREFTGQITIRQGTAG